MYSEGNLSKCDLPTTAQNDMESTYGKGSRREHRGKVVKNSLHLRVDM